MLIAWGLIFLGIIAGYGLWEDVRRDVVPRQSVAQDGSVIEVPRGPGGHYYLTVNVAGTPVEFIVDTGATDVVLTMEDARAGWVGPGQSAVSRIGTNGKWISKNSVFHGRFHVDRAGAL